MKIIFLNIYSSDTIARYFLSSYILKAYLDKHYKGGDKLEIEIFNFSSKVNTDKICKKLTESQPDIIGYSCYIWNIEKIFEIIRDFKNRTKDVIHILGGPEISPNKILSLPDPCIADYYVMGEGERKILRLIVYLDNIRKGNKTIFPKGVACWQNNSLNYLEDTESIMFLDEIPSIYLSGAIEDRLYARQLAFMETQRGCCYRCKYCVYHKNLKSCSYYSLERIFNELDYLIVKKQISALRIFDAVFTTNMERAKKIVRHLLDTKDKRGDQFPWIYWEFTYDAVDEEFIKLVALLKNRNTSRILNSENITPRDQPQHYSDMLRNYNVINCVGVQSFSNEALKAVGRPGFIKEKFDYFINMVKSNNLALKLDLILGLPFETFDSYFAGLEFFLPYFKNTDHVLNIHRLQILPGSELEALCGEYKVSYSQRAPHTVYSTNSMSEHELGYAAKLTAVLFRILNSPFRQLFFAGKESSGLSFYEFVKSIYENLVSGDKFQSSKLVKNKLVDDEYWNDEIFQEIPSQWLSDFLENIVEQGVESVRR